MTVSWWKPKKNEYTWMLLSIFCFLLPLAGCANKYRVDLIEKPISNISAASHFYIMLPEDGRFEEIVYTGSGQLASSAVHSVLQRNGVKYTQASSIQTLAEATAEAASIGADYILQSIILHWEDRATEWSGRPDRITMKYVVVDLKNSEKVASMIVSASSKWATLGGDHPQDLVPKTVQDFIDNVF
jgi:hypothetical protein